MARAAFAGISSIRARPLPDPAGITASAAASRQRRGDLVDGAVAAPRHDDARAAIDGAARELARVSGALGDQDFGVDLLGDEQVHGELGATPRALERAAARLPPG